MKNYIDYSDLNILCKQILDYKNNNFHKMYTYLFIGTAPFISFSAKLKYSIIILKKKELFLFILMFNVFVINCEK